MSSYYAPHATALLPTVDLGQSGTLTVFYARSAPTGTTAGVRVRFSADNATWGAWTSLGNGESIAALRYAQVAAVLTTSDPTKTPEISSITLYFTPPGQATFSLTLTATIDFASQTAFTLPVGGSGAVWGQFEWGQANWGEPGSPVTMARSLGLQGRYLQFKVEGDGAGEPFTFLGIAAQTLVKERVQ